MYDLEVLMMEILSVFRYNANYVKQNNTHL